MPKRMFLIALALASMALASCGASYDPNDLYGTPEPTATPTPMTTPDDAITTATVTVTLSSSALANETVDLYSDSNGHIGTQLATQVTSSTGIATFTGLTGGTPYCFGASYTPSGGLAQNESVCSNLWDLGVSLAF